MPREMVAFINVEMDIFHHLARAINYSMYTVDFVLLKAL
jgi:hypothetical protein